MPAQALDVSVYDAVHTQLYPEDRASVLALQLSLRARRGTYAYLEIGSHLGGSLQPFLADPACEAVYSIDPRPAAVPDERGVAFPYPQNSTERMIRTLEPVFGGALSKLRTFDSDASDVPVEMIAREPDLCWIDGQLTDAATLSDLDACLRLARHDAVIGFANVHIVFRGFRRCVDLLWERGIAHRAYVLPLKIGVIELGPGELWREPAVHERLATATAPLYMAETLAHYRDGILALKRVPGARLARWMLLRLGKGKGLEPRRDDAPEHFGSR